MSESAAPKSSLVLEIWTIYRSPRDYPGKYVARKFWIVPSNPTATSDMFVADTLDEVRALLPPGLVCLQRFDPDDPVIVETWL